MNKKSLFLRLLLVVVVVFLVQLACAPFGPSNDTNLPSENNDSSGDVDLAGTQAALEKTQAALEAAQQPEPEEDQLEELEPEEPADTPEPAMPTDTPFPLMPQLEGYPDGVTLYFTDFDSVYDLEPGWFDFAAPSDNDYEISMNSGWMRVHVEDESTEVFLFYGDMYFPRDMADVYVEARFQNKGTHNINNISVICRATDKGWYEFSMLSGGLWYIWKFDSDKGSFKLIKDGGIPDLDYDAPHTIGGECKGDYLTFYFDGEELKNATIKDTQFEEGQAGIAVYAYEDWENVIVEFDYFGIAVPLE